MISLKSLEKSIETGPTRTWLLRQVTIDIKEGEFVSIMGPSGAGKSTLLSILGMLDGVWSGQFRFLDHDVHAMKQRDRVELNKKYIGFVFQQYHLIDDLTVYENLDIPLSYRDVKKAERAAVVAESLDKFQIVAKKDLYPRQLSGGQRGISFPEYREHRDGDEAFAGLLAYDRTSMALGSGGEPERIPGLIVTGNYFSVLGVRMELGRAFAPEEDRGAGADPVVVLSDALWRGAFAAGHAGTGGDKTLEPHPLTTVPVAPPAPSPPLLPAKGAARGAHR